MSIYLGKQNITNGSSTLPDGCDYVVEYGQSDDGTQWYRLWKSGWLEQGGSNVSTLSGGYTKGTIAFLKSFTNTNYICLTTINNASYSSVIYYKDKTVSSVSWTRDATTSGISATAFDWYCAGF